FCLCIDHEKRYVILI
ncbi:Modulator of FtsH protease YccA, partial [Haemophilus influenzae]